MTLTYSRDGASRPLLVLETMLEEIRTNRFNPNAMRSGRLHNRCAEDAFGESSGLLPPLPANKPSVEEMPPKMINMLVSV